MATLANRQGNCQEGCMGERSGGRQAAQLSLDEFTEATYGSILRAVEARKRPFLGPILFGFIWWPEGPLGDVKPGQIMGGPPQRPSQ
jgi:hypothetical protein